MSVRENLEVRLGEVMDLTRQRSRFRDGHAYFTGGREIAHFHGDGRMDVRLTRQLVREMKAEGTLDPRVRTRGPSADWVTVPLTEERDIALALGLVELAIRANA